MICLQLFLSFLQIGTFAVGGGYAAMPLIQSQVVTNHAWLTMSEFTDLVTIAEMTPGPIAINAATFVGMRTAGIPGALAATFGNVLPSCIIVSILAYIYRKYRKLSTLQGILAALRPAVVALIAAAGCSILQLVIFTGGIPGSGNINLPCIILFSAALLALRVRKWNPILVMALCGVLYLGYFLITG